MNNSASIFKYTVRGFMLANTKDPHNSSSKSPLFYSWVIIISVSLVMMAAGGSRGAFGIFFTPMANDLGWSAAEISGTFSFSMIIEGIVSAISGWLSDKFGTKIVLVFSGLISGTGFVLMSLVHAMWQMYLIYGLAMGIGLGGIVVPIVSILAKRFIANRTIMTGISLAAYGLGQLISPLIAHQLITAYSWRTSYIVLGILLFILIMLPALFLKRPSNKSEETQQVNDMSKENILIRPTVSYTFKEARHTKQFWMMIIMQSCYMYCLLSVMVHTAPYVIEIGIPVSTAAFVLSSVAGAMIVGRLGLGALGDRIGGRLIIIIGFIVLLVSFLCLTQSSEVLGLFLFAIVCGLGLGGISSSGSPLSAEYFGSKSHGSIYGVMAGVCVVLGATGPVMTGYLFDLTGHYQISFMVCSFISFIGLIVCILLRPPHRSVANNKNSSY
jgi:MFS family permease